MSVEPVRAEPVEIRPVPRGLPPAEEIAAWTILGGLLMFALFRHLIAALIMGLTLYLILDRVSQRFSRRMSRSTVRPLALLVVTLTTAVIFTGAIALTVTMLRRGAANLPDMMNKMADILGSV